MKTGVRKTPWRYEPSGDAEDDPVRPTVWTDHFVLSADGEEIACPATEEEARLIAAAPEMLAWLQIHIDNSECSCEDWWTTDASGKCGHCSALAIIAKARGETP